MPTRIDLGRYAPDPIGSAFRGFLGMGELAERRRRADLEERRFKLAEDEAARRRQLFDLQLEAAQDEAAERKKLPGARGAVLGASRPLMSLEEVGADPEVQKLGLGTIRQMSRRPRTLPELLGRLGPGGVEQVELVSRLHPRTMTDLALSTPEAVEREDEATRLTTEALEDIKGGRVIDGLTKANRALILSGQRPAFKDLADVVGDARDRQDAEDDAKALGPLLAGAAGGSEEDAKKLLAAIPGAKSKGFKTFTPHLFNLATTILGAKVSPKVAQGLKRYTELLQEHDGDRVAAMAALTAETPEVAVAIRQAKMLPVEFEEAIRDAAEERREGRYEARAEVRDRLRRRRGGEAQTIAEDTALTEDQKRIRIAALGEDPSRYLGPKAGSAAAVKTPEQLAIRVAQDAFPKDMAKQQALFKKLMARAWSKATPATQIEADIKADIDALRGLTPQEITDAKQQAKPWAEQFWEFFGRGKAAAPAPAGTEAPFDPEGSGYDYAGARAAGIAPDATGHWPSRDPSTGRLLKGRGHETWSKTVEGETAAGFRIIKRADGRYYSVPATPAAPAPGAGPEAERAARDAMVNALYPGRTWQALTQEEKRAVGRRLRGRE